ncbi:hypothetical protein K3X44_14395 [Aliiroseovarius crassostreae]|uniref:3-deoxy-D-manno-octulosonic acid transferase n=1 Tax=Aliiroseovarius crassostreae TaxID=154981 RepID=UPI0021FB97B8|nr:glycosyltransferase N-terminal domain-containing protein [Aliiroseovarius crassostreae]UWQ01622.1 hypothetical protein K3X44_14395 [Aliiroseovarius crassostreae]
MLPPGIYLYQLMHHFVGRRSEGEVCDGLSRPEGGPLIWCQVGDGGELPALEDFIRQVVRTRDDLCFLITLPSGHAPWDPPEDLGDVLLSCALPDGGLKSAKQFLDVMRPDLVLWMDQKLDPPLLGLVHQRSIPALWINARAPVSSGGALPWWRGTMRVLASGFDTILAENEAAASMLSRLGVSTGKIRVVGALQRQTHPPSCNMAERDDMAQVLGARPLWLALNTAAEEEAALVEAHRQVMRKSHRLLLVIVPDDPARAPVLARRLEQDGWVVALRSEDQPPTPEAHIYIADLPEEEGLWMHLSPITFIGHTLSGGGCLSPNAAASLGSAVVFGAALGQDTDAFERLEAAGAARRVASREHLAQEVEYLLQPEHAAQMAMAAWEIITSGAELSGMVEEMVLDLLDKNGL